MVLAKKFSRVRTTQNAYIMEGNSPSFLKLVPNGLAVPEQPN
jgi:hypothetical protein